MEIGIIGESAIQVGSVGLLDACRVTQHARAKIARRRRRIDRTAKSGLDQRGHAARVIDMRVCTIAASAAIAALGIERFRRRDSSRRPWKKPQSMRSEPLPVSSKNIEPVTSRAAPRNVSRIAIPTYENPKPIPDRAAGVVPIFLASIGRANGASLAHRLHAVGHGFP